MRRSLIIKIVKLILKNQKENEMADDLGSK